MNATTTDVHRAMPPSLEAAYSALSGQYKAALLPHLIGGTSSVFLSDWLGRVGHPVSERTIRRFRQSLREGA